MSGFGLKRQVAESDELFCCLPGCNKGVFIYDSDQKLCFCDVHKNFTPNDVEEFCQKYYTDGSSSSSSDSDGDADAAAPTM